MKHDLLAAIEEGDLAAVRQIISEGADVNSRGFLKVTPLMVAVKNGHEDIVRYLLEQPETDVNALNAGGTSALMVAARRGNHGIVKLLLSDTRTDVNQLGQYGGTALIQAAGFGHVDVVRELLRVDDISLAGTYTEKKHSPLSIARQNGHTEIANVLEHFIARRSPPMSSRSMFRK